MLHIHVMLMPITRSFLKYAARAQIIIVIIVIHNLIVYFAFQSVIISNLYPINAFFSYSYQVATHSQLLISSFRSVHFELRLKLPHVPLLSIAFRVHAL